MSRKDGSIKRFKPTLLSGTRGKNILITTQSTKSRAQASFDNILKQFSVPMNTLNFQDEFSKQTTALT